MAGKPVAASFRCGVLIVVVLVAPRVFRAPEGPAAVCVGGRRPASLMVLLVAPRVFRAPEGPAAVCAGGRRPIPLMVLLWPHGCSGRRRPRPPARLGVLTSFGAAPRSPPVPSGPSGALHTGGAVSLACGWVRRLEARPGPAAAHGRRSRVLRTPQCGLACCAGILGRSAACCYKRRQSEVFFVWIFDPLLQTSSIRGLFR